MKKFNNALMVQGTTSSAGKSVLVAGLCRLFTKRGYKVAPFKPQNMALNSAVTIDGGEIGRSQAVQAQACGIPPHTDMNPVLLKPNTDTGAQVIIQGHAIGNMDAAEFHAFKKQAMCFVLKSFQRLSTEYDLVIIEGAGSPAEINLRENDIANMGFAQAVNCPVILAADIDRGGVFAHLLGTLECLTVSERALVFGFVINRFRGDISLLQSGIDWLTEKTGISTIGVLPYLKHLHIEAEDSLDKRSHIDHSSGSNAKIRVLVPRMPRISNHTDFDVLRLNPAVDIQFIEEGCEIPGCDLVILPGSKSSVDDLAWLIKNGWPDYIHRHLRYGGKLIGICGGLQMVGQWIHDPEGVEGTAGSYKGLGLMPYESVLARSKQLQNVSGKLVGTGARVDGYEIHMGITKGPAMSRPAVVLSDGREDGARSEDDQIFCTYLHGLFDCPEASETLLVWCGLKVKQDFDYFSFKEQELDRVADMLEAHLNLDAFAHFLKPVIN